MIVQADSDKVMERNISALRTFIDVPSPLTTGIDVVVFHMLETARNPFSIRFIGSVIVLGISSGAFFLGFSRAAGDKRTGGRDG
jgi:hypothetical protein